MKNYRVNTGYEIENVVLYIQIEQEWKEGNSSQGKLCFKINVDEKRIQSSSRDHWHKVIMQSGSDSGLNIVKPHRFGKGACMTVAMVKEDFRQINENGKIDFDATVDVLRKAERLLESATTRR